MTAHLWFRAYAAAQILAAAGWLLSAFLSGLEARVPGLIGASRILRFNYALLFSLAVLSVASLIFPRAHFVPPAAQIWSPAVGARTTPLSGSEAVPRVSVAGAKRPIPFSENAMETAAVMAHLSAFLIVVSRYVRDGRRLSRIAGGSFLGKRIGRVRVLFSESASVPFSFWWPGRAFVVVPTGLLADSEESRLAVKHELQHHRQGDTKWIHTIQFFKIFLFWNPFFRAWEKGISEAQELACDEVLIGRKNVSVRAYGRCLIRAAESSFGAGRLPACTTGMAAGVSGQNLKRRIELMFTYRRKNRFSKPAAWICALLSGVVMLSAAVASTSVRDRRVSFADAQNLLRKAADETSFPLAVNDKVLFHLNRYLGTPEGRIFLKESLARMGEREKLIRDALSRYGLPEELLAVPLVESGYRNLPASKSAGVGAGLWMFIEPTARHYGLKIGRGGGEGDKKIDERLDVAKETDAAMRFLKKLHGQFGSWDLALLAYNIGETRVEQGIEKTGSRDAWKLIEQGYENDADYLSKVMAAVLILMNPETVED